MTLSSRVIAAMAGAILVALAAVVVVASASFPTTSAIQGDATCNGAVDPSDALAILLETTGMQSPASACVQSNGDTDCDFDADGQDALAILSYLADASRSAAQSTPCTPIGDELDAPTPTETELSTVTPSESETPTPTPTSTPSPDDSQTPTPTQTETPTVTPSPVVTPTPTATPGVCGSLPEAVPDVAPAGLTPGENGYALSLLPADADVEKLTAVVPVPGDPGLAVITGESGDIWTVCLNNDSARNQILDLTDVVRDKNGNNESDEGLTSLVFDPQDPTIVYVIYSLPQAGSYLVPSATPGPDIVRSRISRFQIENERIQRNSEEVILEVYQPWQWHNADGLVFGPDGMLYIGSGDGGAERQRGQTLDDLYGAVLRIDVHSGDPYTIPASNPFADGPGGNADEVWAYGFRNPWRFTFDNGKMWLADVGAWTWEEINLVEPGVNYGWPIMEGHDCFTPFTPPTPQPSCSPAGLTTPRAVYSHYDPGDDCAVTGGHVYHGAAMPELDGYYIYSDYCSGRIWAVDTNDDTSDPIMLADTELHPVSWAITSDGEIVAVNYKSNVFPGTAGIYRLERAP